ncbi:MAG: hypothetical protein JHC93_06300 [Parachlamydiales bacterium]|nr:hypothetical protein [Parachlamydiales bacterium]
MSLEIDYLIINTPTSTWDYISNNILEVESSFNTYKWYYNGLITNIDPQKLIGNYCKKINYSIYIFEKIQKLFKLILPDQPYTVQYQLGISPGGIHYMIPKALFLNERSFNLLVAQLSYIADSFSERV